jgi:ketosteroid isomerase-like protein
VEAHPPGLDDRAAIRRLVEVYAHGCDRRLPALVAALFADHGVLEIYEDAPDFRVPARVRNGPAEIEAALAGLARYAVTSHVLGQSLIDVDGDVATSETYCMAHHMTHHPDRSRRDRVLAIRYLDRFCRDGGRWLIEERRLLLDWSDDRPVSAAEPLPPSR